MVLYKDTIILVPDTAILETLRYRAVDRIQRAQQKAAMARNTTDMTRNYYGSISIAAMLAIF
jgi:hypothetical protein